MKVSVIISAYNAAAYLSQTLDSVVNQTYTDLEIIVVNDGSCDNTLEIAKSYESKGVKVITQVNKGQDAALNNGYHHATGDYIKFMDSDDLINKEMISIQVGKLNGSQVHIAYSEWARFYNNDYSKADFSKLNYWKDSLPVDFLTSREDGVMLQCGIFLIPRKLIEIAGLWDERLILFNDTEFFTRVILKSNGVKFTEGAKLYYRSGLSGSISAQTTRKFFESTFLATNLIADNLLSVEDSKRTRNLIANIYLNQYYLMYPNFPDLFIEHEKKIQLYGGGTIGIEGGFVFKLLKFFFGWKKAKKIKLFFYKIGYMPRRKN